MKYKKLYGFNYQTGREEVVEAPEIYILETNGFEGICKIHKGYLVTKDRGWKDTCEVYIPNTIIGQYTWVFDKDRYSYTKIGLFRKKEELNQLINHLRIYIKAYKKKKIKVIMKFLLFITIARILQWRWK